MLVLTQHHLVPLERLYKKPGLPVKNYPRRSVPLMFEDVSRVANKKTCWWGLLLHVACMSSPGHICLCIHVNWLLILPFNYALTFIFVPLEWIICHQEQIFIKGFLIPEKRSRQSTKASTDCLAHQENSLLLKLT